MAENEAIFTEVLEVQVQTQTFSKGLLLLEEEYQNFLNRLSAKGINPENVVSTSGIGALANKVSELSGQLNSFIQVLGKNLTSIFGVIDEDLGKIEGKLGNVASKASDAVGKVKAVAKTPPEQEVAFGAHLNRIREAEVAAYAERSNRQLKREEGEAAHLNRIGEAEVAAYAERDKRQVKSQDLSKNLALKREENQAAHLNRIREAEIAAYAENDSRQLKSQDLSKNLILKREENQAAHLNRIRKAEIAAYAENDQIIANRLAKEDAARLTTQKSEGAFRARSTVEAGKTADARLDLEKHLDARILKSQEERVSLESQIGVKRQAALNSEKAGERSVIQRAKSAELLAAKNSFAAQEELVIKLSSIKRSLATATSADVIRSLNAEAAAAERDAQRMTNAFETAQRKTVALGESSSKIGRFFGQLKKDLPEAIANIVRFQLVWGLVGGVVFKVLATFTAIVNQFKLGWAYLAEVREEATKLEGMLSDTVKFSGELAENTRLTGEASVAVFRALQDLSIKTGMRLETLKSMFAATIEAGGASYVKTLREAVDLTGLFSLAISNAGAGAQGTRRALTEIPALLQNSGKETSKILEVLHLTVAEWNKIREEGLKHRDLLTRLAPIMEPYLKAADKQLLNQKALNEQLALMKVRITAAFLTPVFDVVTGLLKSARDYLRESRGEWENITSLLGGTLKAQFEGLLGTVSQFFRLISGTTGQFSIWLFIFSTLGEMINQIIQATLLLVKVADRVKTALSPGEATVAANKRAVESLSRPPIPGSKPPGFYENLSFLEGLKKERALLEGSAKSDGKKLGEGLLEGLQTDFGKFQNEVEKSSFRLNWTMEADPKARKKLEDEFKKLTGEALISTPDMGVLDNLIDSLRNPKDLSKIKDKSQNPLSLLTAQFREDLAGIQEDVARSINAITETVAEGQKSIQNGAKESVALTEGERDSVKELVLTYQGLGRELTKKKPDLSKFLPTLETASIKRLKDDYIKDSDAISKAVEQRQMTVAEGAAAQVELNKEEAAGIKELTEKYQELGRQLLKDITGKKPFQITSQDLTKFISSLSTTGLTRLKSEWDKLFKFQREGIKAGLADSRDQLESRIKLEQENSNRLLVINREFVDRGVLTRREGALQEYNVRKQAIDNEIALLRDSASQFAEGVEARLKIERDIDQKELEGLTALVAAEIAIRKGGEEDLVLILQHRATALEQSFEQAQVQVEAEKALGAGAEVQRKGVIELAKAYVTLLGALLALKTEQYDQSKQISKESEQTKKLKEEVNALTIAKKKAAGVSVVTERDNSALASFFDKLFGGSPTTQRFDSDGNKISKDEFEAQGGKANLDLTEIKGTFSDLGSAIVAVNQAFKVLASVLPGIISAVRQGYAQGGVGGAIGAGLSQVGAMIPGPIGAAISIAGTVTSLVSGLFMAATRRMAEKIKKDIDAIELQFSRGSINLVEAITKLEKARADAIAKLSGKKGGKAELDKILPGLEDTIFDLKKQQKEIIENFNDQLQYLTLNSDEMEKFLKSWKEVNKQVKEYLGAGGDAVKANQFLSLSLQKLQKEASESLADAEREAIQDAIRLNDLLDQRNKLVQEFKKTEFDILTKDAIERRQSSAVVEGQELVKRRKEFENQLSDLDRQISLETIRVDKEREIFNLSTDIAELHKRDMDLQIGGINKLISKWNDLKKIVSGIMQTGGGGFSLDPAFAGSFSIGTLQVNVDTGGSPVDAEKLANDILSEIEKRRRQGTGAYGGYY